MWVFCVLLSHNSIPVIASTSRATKELSLVEEFFNKSQVGWEQDAYVHVKNKLMDPKVPEIIKDAWHASVNELFTDINMLLAEEILQTLSVNISITPENRQMRNIFDVDYKNPDSATIFLDPSKYKVISAPASMPESDKWHLGLLPFHPELIVYHEFIHLFIWLHKRREEKLGLPVTYRIFDKLQQIDYFWQLDRDEDGDPDEEAFSRKWGILEEQVVSIGMPEVLEIRGEPHSDRFHVLGKFSEKQIRQAICVPPRYPYITPKLDLDGDGESINPHTTESLETIRKVFYSWIGDKGNFEGANYEGWQPFA